MKNQQQQVASELNNRKKVPTAKLMTLQQYMEQQQIQQRRMKNANNYDECKL